MNNNDIISGLEHLLKESKAAEAKIEFSYTVERMQRKLFELEEKNNEITRLLQIIYEHIINNEL